MTTKVPQIRAYLRDQVRANLNDTFRKECPCVPSKFFLERTAPRGTARLNMPWTERWTVVTHELTVFNRCYLHLVAVQTEAGRHSISKTGFVCPLCERGSSQPQHYRTVERRCLFINCRFSLLFLSMTVFSRPVRSRGGMFIWISCCSYWSDEYNKASFNLQVCLFVLLQEKHSSKETVITRDV